MKSSRKTRSISETLDWARALLALNAQESDADFGGQTLNVILKYEGDVRKAQGELSQLLEKKAAKAQATAESVTKVPEAKAVKKGALH